MLVLANWAAQQTGGNLPERYRWKLSLMRNAFRKGFRREEILELYRLIDWLLQLPEQLEKDFRTDILRNEEQLMPYVTSFERIAREEGREQGREEGRVLATREMISEILAMRFGTLPLEVTARIHSEHDLEALKSMRQLALASKDLDAFLRSI